MMFKYVTLMVLSTLAMASAGLYGADYDRSAHAVLAEVRGVQDTSPIADAIDGLLSGLGVSGIEIGECVGDLEGAAKDIEQAIVKLGNKEAGEGLSMLGDAMHEFAVAVEPCDVADLPARLDQLAQALHIANVEWVDEALKIWIAGAPIEDKIASIINDWNNKDYQAFGNDIAALVGDLANMLHCKDGDKVCTMLAAILKEAAIVVPDIEPCMAAVTPLVTDLEEAYKYYGDKKYIKMVEAITDFAKKMSSAVAPCHLKQFANLLSSIATKLSTATVEGETIKVGPVDITKTVIDMMESWKNGDYDKAGADAAILVADLRSYDCDSKACVIVDGLLQAFGILAYDMKDCKADLEESVTDFEQFITQFEGKQYKDSVDSLEKSLSGLSKGVKACQLDSVAALIDSEAAKLGLGGDVKIVDETVQVLVEGADIFQDLDGIYNAAEAHDYKAAGLSMAHLVTTLQKTVCQNDNDKTCVIVEGILESLEVFMVDMGECKVDVTNAVNSIAAAVHDFSSSDADHVKAAMKDLSDAMHSLSEGVKNCHLDELADVIASQASKLGLANVEIIEEVVHVLINGANIYEDVEGAFHSITAGDYKTFGRFVGDLLKDSHLATCKSPICEFLTTALELISDVAPDFTACEADLQAAWADVELIESDMKAKNYKAVLQDLSRVLEESSKAVKPCHLDQASQLLAQLADELGFHTISEEIEGVVSILVNGENVFDALLHMASAIADKDYKSAGDALGLALKAIMKWHGGNSCDDATCLVLEGFTKALGLLESDWKECEADLVGAWDKIVEAMDDFKNHDSFKNQDLTQRRGDKWNTREVTFTAMDSFFVSRNLRAVQNSWWKDLKDKFKKIVQTVEDKCKTDWEKLKDDVREIEGDKHVKDGMVALASAVDELAKGVSNCHAPEIAKIATDLAAKLGAPVVGWLDTLFTIIFNGAQVYDDVFNAVSDYENKNYFGMGYEVAKLAILIVEDVA